MPPIATDLVTKCDMTNGKVELNVIVEEASSALAETDPDSKTNVNDGLNGASGLRGEG